MMSMRSTRRSYERSLLCSLLTRWQHCCIQGKVGSFAEYSVVYWRLMWEFRMGPKLIVALPKTGEQTSYYCCPLGRAQHHVAQSKGKPAQNPWLHAYRSPLRHGKDFTVSKVLSTSHAGSKDESLILLLRWVEDRSMKPMKVLAEPGDKVHGTRTLH